MSQDYWVSVWARLRQDEVIRVPADYVIHSDFISCSEKSEIQSAFAEINSLFNAIYGDVARQPDEYGMPLHPKNDYRVFSQQWRDSGQAPYRPLILLYTLLICGEMDGQALVIPHETFKNTNKVKQTQFLFCKLAEYGFVFEGLKNNKPIGSDIIVSYPDRTALLTLAKRLADKARNTDRLDDFLCCHFRLLQDDMQTADYGFGADDVADRVHTDAEKEFCYEMDRALMSMGMFRKGYGGFECHGFAYYHNKKDMDSKSPYSFRFVSRGTNIESSVDEAEKLRMLLRIRNVSNCLAYMESCPDSIKQIFTEYSNEGCGKRKDGSCKHGVGYEIDGKEYWHWGCCHAAFNFKPKVDDIPHYIKLVELGEKKTPQSSTASINARTAPI